MRSVRPAARSGAMAIACLAGLVLATPAALAQQTEPDPVPPRWSGSTFDEPFDEFLHEVGDDRITDISGRFHFEKPSATSEIVGAEIVVVDDDSDDFEPDADCDLREPVEVPSDGTNAAEPADQLAFEVEGIRLPCNGRYLLEARADTNVEGESYTMRAALVVKVLPPAVASVTAAPDDASQQVTVGWQPPPTGDLPADVYGYLVERAGPQADDGSFGIFDDLVVVDIDDEPQLVDDVPEPGTYRYRVRTVRRGVDGPVLSSILDGEPETVAVGSPPPTSATTTPSTTRAPRVGAAIPRPPRRTTTRYSPPTTADTGFEEELDYGELPARSTTSAEIPELAAEDPQAGQSIIQDESDGGLDLIIPAAGALVLIGWAGHIAYLNRLARQL